jgi:hypothetical protein
MREAQSENLRCRNQPHVAAMVAEKMSGGHGLLKMDINAILQFCGDVQLYILIVFM